LLIQDVERYSEFRKQGPTYMANFGMRPRAISVVKEEELLLLNWRRGLFRVWLLCSAAWLMGWIIFLIMSGLHGGFKTTGDLLEIPVLLLGPPIALLLFGLAAGWAFRGFKANSGPST
jgi:hypothetical protein